MGAPASPQVIDRYAVYGKIASGGMASVCFGRLLGGEGFARTVAIKRLHPHLAEDPEFRATLIDEARMAARIHHPNVVPTLDVVTAGGELLVVMEYVRGESLARLLKIERARGRRVPLPIVSAVATGSLHGLHAAHEATGDSGTPLDIVHRDVSPQNLLVGIDGLARVIDFGVAKAAGRLQMTREGTIKGKMAYMAPEQIAGHDVTRRADVYAMGVVLWETLTGERLFRGENDAALVVKVLAGAQDPPSRHAPGLPPGLDELVMTALAIDPEERFASAREMATMLERIVPPSLPADVGRWVEEAARVTLSQRGAELAEIESSSGIAMIPAPVSARSLQLTGGNPSRASQSGHSSLSRRTSQSGHSSLSRPSQPSSQRLPPAPGSPVPGEITVGFDDEGASGASQPSQPSSLSLGSALPAMRPSASPSQNPRRGMTMIALATGALLALGILALWRGATAPSATVPSGAAPSAETAPATTQAAPTTTTPPAPSPTAPWDQPLATAAAPPSPNGAPTMAPTATTAAPLAPAGPRPPRPPHVGHPAAPATPAQPAAPPKPAAKSGCNPPYVIDSAGDRQYKPECL